MNVAVFGCGYIGSRWVKILDGHKQIDTVYCVDTDPDVLQDISQFEVNFLCIDVLSAESGTEVQQAEYRVLVECDLWIVCTGYEYHMDLISVAESASVSKVLVEKPVFKPQHFSSSRFPEQLPTDTPEVYVNYVEAVHPYYQTVVSQAVADNATITNAFHWREKDHIGPVGFGRRHQYEHPAVKEDLVHDISELYFALQELNQPSSFTLDTIQQIDRWDEYTVDNINPFSYFDDDSWANVRYTTDSGEYTIQGGFTGSEMRRFFVWIDDTHNTSYYASTLPQPSMEEHNQPVSTYRLNSAEAGYELRTQLEQGVLPNKELLQQYPGSRIECTKSQHTFSTVIDQLVSDQTTLPTLYDAYEIELIAEQFYENASVEYGTHI